MADFHAGALGTKGVISEGVFRLTEEKPDLVLLLGDYIDGAMSHRMGNMAAGGYVFDMIREVKAPLGIFGLLGDHDNWTDASAVRSALANSGAVVLDNCCQRLDGKLCLAGVDDYGEGAGGAREGLGGDGTGRCCAASFP